MADLIQTELFAALAPYITAWNAGNRMIEFRLPHRFRHDADSINIYLQDAIIKYEGIFGTFNNYYHIEGYVKDATLFDYLIDEHMKDSPEYG